jgi:hypothetical protein
LIDYQGELMNYTVTTTPNIGMGTGTSVGNGRVTIPVSGIAYSQTYMWYASVTDGIHWTNKTFTFTTEVAFDLIVTNIHVVDNNCSLYSNSTCSDGTPYYYPVEVTVQNTGIDTTGQFYVKLEVYWINGSGVEASQELQVPSLSAGGSTKINFTSLFHPIQNGPYQVTATVDSRNEVSESNETNNVLSKQNINVTMAGNINGDGTVNLFDAIVISVSWGAKLGDPQWNVKADLNHDGVVDILDATLLSLHWGESQ